MARISSIDYILVHEFSHLVHMNHSKDFYSLVKKIMPSYIEEEDWLKENSYNVKL
jgi:predicted metal-dependent hydrolase